MLTMMNKKYTYQEFISFQNMNYDYPFALK